MSTCKLSSCYKKKYIKNNNLCKTISIILVNLSFLLAINTNVSYLQRRTLKIKVRNECVFTAKIIMHAYPGGRRHPRTFFRCARRGPSLPRAGRVNQSCLTADIWFHSECGNTVPHRSKDQHTARGSEGLLRVAPQGGSSGWLLRVAPQGGSSGWLRFMFDI